MTRERRISKRLAHDDMMNAPPITALRDLCELIADCPHSTPLWTDHGAIVLRNQNIRNGRLDLSQASFTDEGHFRLRTRRAEPRPGDIVITREAPMGEACMIPKGLRCCLGQRMVLLRPSNGKCDPRFLLYALQSPQVQHEIRVNEGTGSTVSNLRIPLLEKLEIPTPALVEQKAIAHILGTLDDKIELNRRMNQTLEGIARAIFKSWFVDFDPVRFNQNRARKQAVKASRTARQARPSTGDSVNAKAEGGRLKDEAKPGQVHPPSFALDPSVAALFPDSFTDSPLGPIPKGWRIGKVAETASIAKHNINPLAYPGETFDHYSIPAFDSEQMPTQEQGAAIKSNKHLLSTESVLVSKLNPRFIRVWLPTPVADRRPVCSTEFLDFRPIPGFTREFLYCFFVSPAFQDVFATLVTGTSSSHQRVHGAHVTSLDCLCPPSAVVRAFSDQVGPMVQCQQANKVESRTLAAIRDALLPKLLSGEIRVKGAEEFVGRSV